MNTPFEYLSKQATEWPDKTCRFEHDCQARPSTPSPSQGYVYAFNDMTFSFQEARLSPRSTELILKFPIYTANIFKLKIVPSPNEPPHRTVTF